MIRSGQNLKCSEFTTKIREETVGVVKDNPKWNLSIQQQKILNIQ